LETYTIGQLAARTDVSVETIRYYERVGLMKQPQRPDSGYRRYPEDARRRLAFIRKAKALGFTLNEILQLLTLTTGSESACRDVKETATTSIRRIEEQIRALSQMRRALGKLVEECLNGGPNGDCPIIQALEEAED
jgi:Hg(II)-responsive transcriptional regulator